MDPSEARQPRRDVLPLGLLEELEGVQRGDEKQHHPAGVIGGLCSAAVRLKLRDSNNRLNTILKIFKKYLLRGTQPPISQVSSGPHR